MILLFLSLLLPLFLCDFGVTLAMPLRKRPSAASVNGKAPKSKKAAAKVVARLTTSHL